MKKNEVKKYTFDPSNLWFIPPEDIIKDLIFKTNDWFMAFRDPASNISYVECKSQPEDSYDYGIFWREIKQTPPE